MSSRNLRDLDSRFRPIAEQLIEDCDSLGVPVTIICTLRTLEEQKIALLHGTSWTTRSKHLPQEPEDKSWAIDLCPTSLLMEKGWAPKHPAWWVIAENAVARGLRSGMDWQGVGLPKMGTTRPSWDPGHCEWKGPK